MAGDEADAAGPARELPLIVEHVPEAVPAIPPPSNRTVEPDTPAFDIPVPTDVPVIELPRPDVVPAAKLPVPDSIGGLPKELCGIEPPMPVHCVTLPIVDVPSIGLTPGVLSSVAPKGMPVGETGGPGPMPSGDVGLRLGTELAVPPSCANAGLHARNAASMLTMNVLRMTPVLPPKRRSRVGYKV
jgi:hypothetical protein